MAATVRELIALPVPQLEELSREVSRISGLRARYSWVDEQKYYPSLRPAIAIMTEALEDAHKAAGSGNSDAIAAATIFLRSFND